MDEARKKYMHNWHIKNRAKRQQQRKLWKQNNPDKVRQYRHINYERHAEHIRTYSRNWWIKHREKAMNTVYLKKYGISYEQWKDMFESQRGVCAVCDRPEQKNRHLCVDHNHKTSVVRGLLCGKCNSAMGLLEENIAILESMILYLKEKNNF